MATKVKKEFKAGLATRLADATLQAETGDENRVFYRNPRKPIEYSQVTYFILNDVPDNVMDKYGKFTMYVQIDIWATKGSKCDDIQDVIESLLYDYRIETTSFVTRYSRPEGSSMTFESDAGIEQRSTTWKMRIYKKGV